MSKTKEEKLFRLRMQEFALPSETPGPWKQVERAKNYTSSLKALQETVLY